jgi:hypothetical protein
MLAPWISAPYLRREAVVAEAPIGRACHDAVNRLGRKKRKHVEDMPVMEGAETGLKE